jgi:hypothetical protein
MIRGAYLCGRSRFVTETKFITEIPIMIKYKKNRFLIFGYGRTAKFHRTTDVSNALVTTTILLKIILIGLECRTVTRIKSKYFLGVINTTVVTYNNFEPFRLFLLVSSTVVVVVVVSLFLSVVIVQYRRCSLVTVSSCLSRVTSCLRKWYFMRK